MSVFRAYDIRGLYPIEIDDELARKIGSAFGTLLKKQYGDDIKVAVSRDARVHGPQVQSAFIDGLASTGALVYNIGMTPTPLVYYTVVKHNLDAGVSVTASHNPKEYNGFKLCLRAAEPLGERGIKELEQTIQTEEYAEGQGRVEELNVLDDYIADMSEKFKLSRKLKVVIDAGNGVAGITAPKIFRNIGCEVTEMYCEPDGNFPNHVADPLVKETLKNLRVKVTEVGADFGVAYDGDGDRSGFVDGNGNIIKNDEAFAIMIKYAAQQGQGFTVVYDISSSKVVEDVIKQSGGTPLVSRVGYPFLRATMKEKGCIMGGEGSGHYFFRENNGYDDAVFASLVFTKMASEKSIDELMGSLPKYITSDDTRIDCPDAIKFQIPDRIKESLKSQGIGYNDIDGVKAAMGNGWFLIRPSNTVPKIVLRWEGSNEEEFRKIGEFARQQLDKAMES